MTPFKILVIGEVTTDQLPELEAIMWIVKGPIHPGTFQHEHYLATKRIVDSVDMVYANFGDREPNFNEGVILQMAYSKSTPIAAGGTMWNSVEYLPHMKALIWHSVDEFVDHILAHYC